MQNHFNRVFNALDKQMDITSGHQNFKAMQHLSSTFMMISSPRSLLASLKDSTTHHYDKDKLLYELVMLKKDNGPFSGFAGIMLLLAMRPVLFSLCMNLDRMMNNPPETMNEVVAAFFKAVESWNPEKMDRVAVNLKWKTRKIAMEVIRQEQKEREWLSRFAEERDDQMFAYRSEDTNWQSSDLEVDDLTRKLRSILNWPSRDVDLLVLRLVMDSSWQVVGVKTGLKPESARKRCRLLKRKLAAMNLSDALNLDSEGF